MKHTHNTVWPIVISAVLAAIFVFMFLYLEQQWEIAVLAVGLVGVLFSSARYGVLKRVEVAASDNPGMTLIVHVIAAMLVIVFLRDEHFALLMLATVFLYATICLGMTLQFGYGASSILQG